MKQAISTTGPPRPDVWAAWQHELQSQRDVKLATDLRQRERALFPRFSDYYGRLHALPRRWRRGIGRRLRQSLAGVALLLALGHGAAFAATINVDGAVCTLADAITAANTDTATGGCPAGSGPDTLVLPAGSTTTLTTVNNNLYGVGGGPNGLPVISTKVTIEGKGSTIKRSLADATPDFRILQIGPSGDLSLKDTTITGGKAAGGGGGIQSWGDLSISNSTISGNSVSERRCGPWLICSAVGGGIDARGDLTISETTISSNFTEGNFFRGRGGGIFSTEHLVITDSTISGNSAEGEGGGISGSVYITGSTISNNMAGTGGGIAGDGKVTTSTVSGNSAGGSGGGIFVGAGCRDANLILENSTVSGNVAADFGGGLAAYGTYIDGGGGFCVGLGGIDVRRSIVSGNTSSGVVSGTPWTGGAELAAMYYSEISSAGFNIFGDNNKPNAAAFYGYDSRSGIELAPTDIIATSDGTNPTPLEDILDPVLAFNGGLTRTHALVEYSPAVDAAGVDCPPPDTDQRGINRPQGAACDIGAFEGWVGNVHDLVTFDPDPSSYESTRDATGCPAGYAGRYGFNAALANVSGLDLNSLSSNIDTLTGGNLVLAPDGELLGTGDKVPVVREGDYADGTLSPGETVETPFEICMKKWRSFQFFVDAYGSAVTD